MFVMVAKMIALASLVGPIQAARLRGDALAQLALDGVARHDRHVHEQAERDDQRRDRDLLDVDAQDLA